MKIWLPVLCLLACTALQAQQDPETAELPGKPFYLKQAWTIGGEGNWDYLALDPVALQLFIAHGTRVQVVDVKSGTVAGEIPGMREAHGIALDDSGQFGYVSDGPASQVRVFDRRTFKVTASLPTGPNPRAIVFEPQNKLVFAVSAQPQTPNPAKPGGAGPANDRQAKSTVTVIDAQKVTVIATILLPGRLGFAQTGGRGRVYINVPDRNQIASLDVSEIVSAIHDAQGSAQAPTAQPGTDVLLDWSVNPRPAQSSDPASGNPVRFLSAGPECRDPRSLAVDAAHLRLFVACGNMRMAVLNATTGDQVAYFPIGPGADAIGFDADRQLIYTANGGAEGSVTIIRQDVTDTYSVIQNLPTRRRARTLAVNSGTGDVYLVTDAQGVDLSRQGGIGTLKTVPVTGSFQVLVVGN